MPNIDITSSEKSQRLYKQQHKEHARTRHENDNLLLNRLNEIEQGGDVDTLQRFAKAYLGLYFDVDNMISPVGRVNILTNEELSKSIFTGIKNIVNYKYIPNIEDIATSLKNDQPLDLGYIVLSALDLLSYDDPSNILQLDNVFLSHAICFSFSNPTEINNNWLQLLLDNKPKLVASSLIQFWTHLIHQDLNYLPGLSLFLDQAQYDQITKEFILPILRIWTNPRKKILRSLLHSAIRLSDHTHLIEISTQALSRWDSGEPSRYILWLATAYLLQPERNEQQLLDYCQRSKEKSLPLMDFLVLVFNSCDSKRLPIQARYIASLLRVIAAKIAPAQDRYGQLCGNTRKLMSLFYRLTLSPEQGFDLAMQSLKKVRVMKLYIDILNFISEQRNKTQFKSFEEFLAELQTRQIIKPRHNRFNTQATKTTQ